MLTNQYTAFGNNMLEKYAGMVSAINPLSLFYLKNETQEEAEPQQAPTQITYVQNQIRNVNHHHYHTMANRYMINYHKTMNLIAANPVYDQNPNFRRDLMPAKLIHTQAPKSEEETKEETKEIIRALVKQVVSEYKETLTKEKENRVQVQNFLTVLSGNPTLQQRILPVLEKNIHTVWIKHEKESEKEIVREMTTVLKEVMEQAAQRLPDQYRKSLTAQRGQNLRMQAQEIITQKEVNYLAETVTKQMTVKAEEIRKRKVTEVSEVQKQSIGTVPLSVQQKQRIGKERFQTQVMGRISPLPVRPTALFFPKEKQPETENAAEHTANDKENTDAGIVQKINYVMKKETAAEHKYYTHLLERFLHKEKEVRTQEVDRSKQPAGIIWHQKPKENIRFERQEILMVPMNLVHETVGQKNADAVNAAAAGVNTVAANTASALQAPAFAESYGDYQTRQLVRRTVPDFTKTRKLISVLQYADKGVEDRTSNASQIAYSWKNGMLELVLPKTAPETDLREGNTGSALSNIESASPSSGNALQNTAAALLQNLVIAPRKERISAYSGGSVSMPHAAMIMPEAAGAAGNTVVNQSQTRFASVVGPNAPGIAFALPDAYSAPRPAPAVPAAAVPDSTVVQRMPNAAAPAVSPVPLVYKQENDQSSQQQQEIKKIEEKTEFLEDIVFEKKVVTKDTKYTYNTTTESQQETQTVSQMPGGMSPNMAGGAAVSRAEVDEIVSESVSRQMDVNIPRISKQVYKDIERQLKKERERRGMK